MIEEIFATRLKELRIEKSLSQNELGLKVGVNQRKISKLETMQLAPSLRIIVSVAQFFEVSADYLLGLED